MRPHFTTTEAPERDKRGARGKVQGPFGDGTSLACRREPLATAAGDGWLLGDGRQNMRTQASLEVIAARQESAQEPRGSSRVQKASARSDARLQLQHVASSQREKGVGEAALEVGQRRAAGAVAGSDDGQAVPLQGLGGSS